MKSFGKNPSGEHLKSIARSANYKNGAFQNLSETVMTPDESMMSVSRKFFFDRTKKTPPGIVPSVNTDLKKLPVSNNQIIWFGHSSYLLIVNEKKILVDPVFSGHASPFSTMVKAFPGSNIFDIEDLPEIDLLLITHDHYDHLDYGTVLKLKNSTCPIFTSAGVSSHFLYWGFDKKRITEFDWWESHAFDNDIRFTATPARHFSGRGLTRAKTLWSSFVLESGTSKIYIGGDSGYESHFAEIGNKFNRFDLALLECGQYNHMWRHIHMMPEQTVQASLDLNADQLIPVHWGKFSLALHPWNEPVSRAHKEATLKSTNILSPKIGEAIEIGKTYRQEEWWDGSSK